MHRAVRIQEARGMCDRDATIEGGQWLRRVTTWSRTAVRDTNMAATTAPCNTSRKWMLRTHGHNLMEDDVFVCNMCYTANASIVKAEDVFD